jgi:arylsulfatase A-like enzyme
MPTRIPAGLRVDAPALSVDLPLTVLDLLGMERSPRPFGRSLVPLLEASDATTERPVFAERRKLTQAEIDRARVWREKSRFTFEDDHVAGLASWQVCCVVDGWKCIWSASAEDELYNLVEDPQESVNLIESEPERGRKMLALIELWKERCQPWTTGLGQQEEDASDVPMLRALGY